MDIEEGEVTEADGGSDEGAVETGIAGTDIVVLPEHSPNPDHPEGWPTFSQATVTCLNRAIRRCRDLEKLELIIDIYAKLVPEVFRGSWHRLEEMTSIHTAIRAKRLDVVQLLVNKGLAPECNDTVMGKPLMAWGIARREERIFDISRGRYEASGKVRFYPFQRSSTGPLRGHLPVPAGEHLRSEVRSSESSLS
ncbi:hypothetical protein PG994_009751 [Apiospora phragmitis]|uniref:Ankyrin repeat protein n=1 Tax=Apiospora phragmitis TaxID=2905665 RepID=A0ABR1U720_9PEZI